MSKRRCFSVMLGAMIALGVGAPETDAQCKNMTIAGSEGQSLGTSIAANEARTAVAIGAPWFPSQTGVVVVYRDGAFEQTLSPPSGTNEQRFGASVGFSDNRIVAAAPSYRSSAVDFTFGAVWTFTYDGDSWSGERVRRGEGAGSGDKFASVVALDGDRLLTDFEPKNGAKRVDVYRREGGAWVKDDEIALPDRGAQSTLASALVVQGHEAFVSATVASDQLEGAVYVFELDGGAWSLADTLRAPTPAANDEFGAALAVNGTVLLIGAPGTDTDHGAAHVFRKIGGTWTFETTLTDDPLTPGAARFGAAVDLQLDLALVGAPAEADALVGGTAASFVRESGNWSRQAKYVSSQTEMFDELGASLAIAGDAYVGAPSRDGATSDEGGVFVFDIQGCRTDCNEDGVDDECAIEAGVSNDFDDDGTPDDCRPPDFDGDGTVGFNDLVLLLGAWGRCDRCREDLDRSGSVGFNDLSLLLGQWGPTDGS